MTIKRPAHRPTADDLTFDAATPPHREPEPKVDPAREAATTTVPAVSESPDIASLFASNMGPKRADGRNGGMNIPVAALLAPPVEPELDLVAATVQVPRYVAETLRLASLLSRSPQRRIATEALKAYLPGELLDEAYRAAGGGPVNAPDRPAGGSR